MAGIDDQVSVVGDWAPPNPSPRTFFSTILGDDFGSRSFSEFIGENGSEDLFVGSEKQKVEVSLEEEVGTRDGVSGDFFAESSFFSGQKSSSRGGLAERMAARAGFNAPRLNTARIRSANLSSSPEIRSPYLTIPPGLSPTTLLDSPVFLSNSLAQPSPTTGKFSFAPSSHSKSSMMMSDALDGNKDNPLDDVDSSTFVFKPHVESSSTLFSGAANKVTPSTNSHQSFPSIEVSVQAEQSLQFRSHDHTQIHAQNFNGFHPQAAFQRNPSGNNITSDSRLSDTIVGNTGHSPPLNDQQDGDGEQRGNGELNSVVGGTPSEDGYNWRKYGQKQVKGSEYPRSYYKCTHPNCQVKKKVERSHEGHITEIIYKGNHNHPKPPPNRRSIMGSANLLSDMQIDIPDQVGARAGMDSDAAWANNNTQGGIIGGGPDWRIDGLEVTSSASMGPPDLCDPSTSLQVQNGPQLESADTVDVLSNLSNDEDEDDRGTHGSVSLGYDEGDESESKRRKIEQMEMSGATRAIREPRVVVQTTSEVDILDDGYRWRKYGQKVVKGNPNPRSYYKCTNAGCTVRKHVERASHDLKSVITTYEGKHNHDVPVARNSTHANSGTSSNAPPPTAQPHVHRPEPSQVHDSMARFERPSSLGSFNLSGRQSMGPTPGFSFGMSQPGLANLAMATLGPTQGRLPMLPVQQPYIGQQQRPMNEMGFVMPKGEPKEEPMSDPGMNNLSNGSSVYHHKMSRMLL